MANEQDPANTIIVVDDDVNIRKALGIILRKEKYSVLEVASGHELKAILKTTRPKLVFLDVMMPGENGFDICADLKADRCTSAIAVFLVTARGMKQDVNKGFSMGADEYVLKPFFTKDVVALVKKYMSANVSVSADRSSI